MRTLTRLSFCLAPLLVIVAARAEERWKKIENDSFSFSVPTSFKNSGAHGIDSFVEEYVGDGIKLSFDYGICSDNFSDWPKETKFEDLKIDGKQARVGTATRESHEGFPYATMVHIKLDSKSNRGLALSMFAACKSEKEAALAKSIFQTIVFKTQKT